MDKEKKPENRKKLDPGKQIKSDDKKKKNEGELSERQLEEVAGGISTIIHDDAGAEVGRLNRNS